MKYLIAFGHTIWNLISMGLYTILALIVTIIIILALIITIYIIYIILRYPFAELLLVARNTLRKYNISPYLNVTLNHLWIRCFGSLEFYLDSPDEFGFVKYAFDWLWDDWSPDHSKFKVNYPILNRHNQMIKVVFSINWGKELRDFRGHKINYYLHYRDLSITVKQDVFIAFMKIFCFKLDKNHQLMNKYKTSLNLLFKKLIEEICLNHQKLNPQEYERNREVFRILSKDSDLKNPSDIAREFVNYLIPAGVKLDDLGSEVEEYLQKMAVYYKLSGD